MPIECRTDQHLVCIHAFLFFFFLSFAQPQEFLVSSVSFGSSALLSTQNLSFFLPDWEILFFHSYHNIAGLLQFSEVTAFRLILHFLPPFITVKSSWKCTCTMATIFLRAGVG
jgi:hypothetical protein